MMKLYKQGTVSFGGLGTTAVDATLSDIKAALAEHGLVAVPVEPTGDMIGAGNFAIGKSMSGTELDFIYAAMINAAQT